MPAPTQPNATWVPSVTSAEASFSPNDCVNFHSASAPGAALAALLATLAWAIFFGPDSILTAYLHNIHRSYHSRWAWREALYPCFLHSTRPKRVVCPPRRSRTSSERHFAPLWRKSGWNSALPRRPLRLPRLFCRTSARRPPRPKHGQIMHGRRVRRPACAPVVSSH